MISFQEYLDFKKYIDSNITEEYNDTWIKTYIEKYLSKNNIKLENIKRYQDRKVLNRYLLDLYENNLLEQLRVLTDMYKYTNKHFVEANRMQIICEKLSLIPDRY